MLVVRHILLLTLGWIGVASALSASPPPTLVSDAPGFLFVEGEPVTVALERTGPAREAVYHYDLKDTDTPWQTQGEGTLPKLRDGEKQRVTFELPLRERGLYHLHVFGKSGQTFKIDQTVARTFAPRPIDAHSPWGIFYVPPAWFAPNDPSAPDRGAASLRRLGASWVRLNFWASAMEPITLSAGLDGTTVTPDLKRWKNYAVALHREGLQIMGEIAQMPRVLSSEQTNEQTLGDGGPAYNRSKPADYAAWEQLMEKIAREFSEEIQIWEIWNEPDNQGVYWRGSPDELVELVRHTAAGLRRGNPKARIAGCGFTSSLAGRFFAEAALRAGLAKELDVFTFHYTDTHPAEVVRWRELLALYHQTLPLWNTEERSPVPIFDREQGVEHSFKFLHVAIGYEESEPLVDKDYTVRPSGLAFAVGAQILGNAQYVRTEIVPGGSLHLFTENGSAIGVFQSEPLARFLAGASPSPVATLINPPQETPLHVTNLRGKTREEHAASRGEKIPLFTTETLLFLHGWTGMEIEPVSPEKLGRFEAENGHYGPYWRRAALRDSSGQAVLEMDPNAPPGAVAEVTIDFTVIEEGDFDLLLAAQPPVVNGNPDTPFTWAMDGNPGQLASRLPAPLPGGEAAGARLLGTLHLAKGSHSFRWAAAGPAPVAPGWQLDALAIRRASPGLGRVPTKKG